MISALLLQVALVSHRLKAEVCALDDACVGLMFVPMCCDWLLVFDCLCRFVLELMLVTALTS